jgi:hypothetical protein
MAEIAIERLHELKHLDVSALNGRVIPLHALRDGEKWHLWFPATDRLIHADTAVPVECCYFAEQPVAAGDFYFQLLEFLQQRAYWPDVARYVDGLYGDLQNAGASLSKLKLIFDHSRHNARDTARMVVTEIEYVFLTCRSIFDLLQEVIVALSSKVRLFSQDIKKVNLPRTYRKMVLRDERPMSKEEIINRFRLPEDIAAIYASSEPFFTWLRSYRDLVAHSGHTPDRVFVTEKGFAISKGDRPFRDMEIWCEANSLPNELGSVLSVMGHVLATTFATCDLFAEAFSKTTQFPPPVAPNHHIFVCGPHLHNLASLNEFVQSRPWYDSPAAAHGT